MLKLAPAQWPRKAKITFSPDLDGRRGSVILLFPSPEVEDKFLNNVAQSAKKPINGRPLVKPGDKIVDKIEDIIK